MIARAGSNAPVADAASPVAPLGAASGATGGVNAGRLGRRTIGAEASVEGVGLHLGRPCRLVFRPAASGAGIVFHRADLPGSAPIPARVDMAVEAERRTQLGEGEAALHTVEHVLAAVGGLAIDDLIIEMDGPEPPIMDGSATPFFEALTGAGLVLTEGRPDWLVLRKSIRVVDGESVYEAHPCFGLSLDVSIDFPHPLIGAQRGTYMVTPATFREALSGARTFGFMHEVEALRAKGLIQGASTANAIVLDANGLVDTALRWPDEFVRHKALDCVGDLVLAGARVRARIDAHKPSHRGTVALVRALVQHATREPSVYTVEDILQVLPHRYPFLLVERILALEEGKRIVGLKNGTINEPFFQGHFPGHPIMPGVLIIEAMAQVGGMLLMRTIEDPSSKVVYFLSLDNVKFRRPVKPGDQLRLELEVMQMRGTMCKMKGTAYVDGQVVTEADMAAMVRDR
ncbi:bifunctional UDP-3-O-[3-hydroxymyristoyl] N-acetylglucosamine deacetylase/3-hydroxyacyl-ACP dehydratase [Gemmatimonas sp.]|uniref:bifunctional UDP-3-O-[3-hydroxymyristoyl] N-acetylglucosamine deacetylase/3-hydroxyacyl-ACP dehydratase n=1 Tax=Gemmatimonas sp. TaxID=1962908 RepID=UPI00391F1E34